MRCLGLRTNQAVNFELEGVTGVVVALHEMRDFCGLKPRRSVERLESFVSHVVRVPDLARPPMDRRHLLRDMMKEPVLRVDGDLEEPVFKITVFAQSESPALEESDVRVDIRLVGSWIGDRPRPMEFWLPPVLEVAIYPPDTVVVGRLAGDVVSGLLEAGDHREDIGQIDHACD